MFEPRRPSNEQQGLEELNKKLAVILEVKVNPGLPTEDALKTLQTRMSELRVSDSKVRNNRLAARDHAAKLVENHCPKEALQLLLHSEAGAVESLDNENDKDIKADALMRSIERFFPVLQLVTSEQVQALLTSENDREGITAFVKYIHKRILETKDSLEGAIVHDPHRMTIDEFYNKRFADIAQRLETKLFPSSGPAAKK